MPPTDATTKKFVPIGDPGLDNDPMVHLSRVFVYFLQNLFRDFPEGCGMSWTPNEETSELVISAEKPRQEAIERRPHITCVLGAGQWSGIGLDQFLARRSADGRRTHTDLMSMNMSYHCQAKEGLVARRLAFNASYYTNILRRIILKHGHLHDVGTRHSIGPESGLSAYTGPSAESDLVEVVVMVPFYWQPQWRITDLRAPKVEAISVDMQVFKSEGIFSAGRQGSIGFPPALPDPPVFTQTALVSQDEEEE